MAWVLLSCDTVVVRSKMNRTKFETLVTIHVHQKDLFQEVWKKVREQKVKDEHDFEWLKQTRLYWKSETDHAVISIADVDFVYSYEYLGVKERLVITALTDRCYVTQSQALCLHLAETRAHYWLVRLRADVDYSRSAIRQVRM
ncbi:unnamed protein product [Prorocentrum cordatum]|uniref:Dynein heavy chain hydrolytic ATP-binding dynein motor region domain-containing protein n=1 Tax=Prorocentrum cordatum TaxID=2364126 RepID=A0ABN9PKN4_9DINO|nr:unnamed protein product [Polarella glacialis]